MVGVDREGTWVHGVGERDYRSNRPHRSLASFFPFGINTLALNPEYWWDERGVGGGAGKADGEGAMV